MNGTSVEPQDILEFLKFNGTFDKLRKEVSEQVDKTVRFYI